MIKLHFTLFQRPAPAIPSSRAMLLLLVVSLPACQSHIYLMPTPVAFHTGELDPYNQTEKSVRTNITRLYYVTNRPAEGPVSDRTYVKGITDTLRFGEARLRLGDEAMSWEKLHAISTSGEQSEKTRIYLEQASELGTLEGGQGFDTFPEEMRAFVNSINKALAMTASKDITIYVHGAVSNFYQVAAQAAQFQHFLGQNQVILLFSWPTSENMFLYGTDVANARGTAPHFSRLLEFLARYIAAEHINILSYSAGAKVASNGLYHLGLKYADETIYDANKKLKWGELYFAAPDVSLKTFVEQLPTFGRVARNITIAINMNDLVLRISKMHHGVSRLGRPDIDELSEEETRMILAASRGSAFDVINIHPASLPLLNPGTHDFWFSHPWVSSDVLVQLFFHAGPSERGLVSRKTERGGRLWDFPPDYPEKVVPAVKWLQGEAVKK